MQNVPIVDKASGTHHRWETLFIGTQILTKKDKGHVPSKIFCELNRFFRRRECNKIRLIMVNLTFRKFAFYETCIIVWFGVIINGMMLKSMNLMDILFTHATNIRNIVTIIFPDVLVLQRLYILIFDLTFAYIGTTAVI